MHLSDHATPAELAQRLLDCHGDEADLHALDRYNERVIDGDVQGCLRWRRVISLIGEALRVRRRGA